MFQLILISAVMMTGYLAFQLLRLGGPARRPYAYMLLADGIAALVSLSAARSADGATRVSDMLGAIAVGGFVCLVMVPPALRDLARRALASDRIGLALRLLDLRELLQPGMGAKQDRDLIATDAAVRAGRVDEALAALRARRAAAEEQPLLRRALDERIVFTLLYARRWRQALDHYERTIEASPGPTSAPLLVEVVRAYGEEDELDKAAQLMDRLERSPVSQEPMLLLLVARARMVFLAFTGRPREVEALLAPAGVLGVMPPAARAYWIGVARLRGGDAPGARAALTDAVQMAGRDPRSQKVAAELLASIPADAGGADVAPPLLAPEVLELVDRVAASAKRAPGLARAGAKGAIAVPRLEGVSLRETPVTLAIIVANLVVAALVQWRLGSSQDPWVLVGAGANLKSAVRAGEYWRLHASVFLHVGALHLLLNMYGMWVLGKIVEQILGSARTFAVYSLAGVGGALASVLYGGDGISAGASGAIFGMLGAAIAELALRRKDYPERWRKALLSTLVFLAVAQLAIGGVYPAIDQSAHIGGLLTGMLATAALAPRGRFGKTGAARALTVVVAAVALASMAWSGVSVATTRYGDTLAHAGFARRKLGPVTVEAPRLWVTTGKGELADPTFGLSPTLAVDREVDAPARAEEKLAQLDRDQKTHDVQRVAPSYPAPPGWTLTELRLSYDLSDGRRFFRYTLFTHAADGAPGLVLSFTVPEALLHELAPTVARIVGSVTIAE